MWALIGHCFGTNSTPRNSSQYKQWIQIWVPNTNNIHHFGYAAICWAIWKCRNKAVFDGKTIRHPAEILFHACSFMNYWAGLYNSDFQGSLMEGVKVLMAYAQRVLAQQTREPHPSLLLTPPEDPAEEEE